MSKIKSELWGKAKRLAARNYDIQISEDVTSDGRIYLVENPELPGCMAQGETLAEALKELHEGRIDFIYFLLEDGLEVPEPQPTQTTTGVTSVGHRVSFLSASPNVTADYPVIDNSEPDEDDDSDFASQPDNRRGLLSISIVKGDFSLPD